MSEIVSLSSQRLTAKQDLHRATARLGRALDCRDGQEGPTPLVLCRGGFQWESGGDRRRRERCVCVRVFVCWGTPQSRLATAQREALLASREPAEVEIDP